MGFFKNLFGGKEEAAAQQKPAEAEAAVTASADTEMEAGAADAANGAEGTAAEATDNGTETAAQMTGDGTAAEAQALKSEWTEAGYVTYTDEVIYVAAGEEDAEEAEPFAPVLSADREQLSEGQVAVLGVTAEHLRFDNFPFKLAVIEVLMYELGLLPEYRGGDAFMEQYSFEYEEATNEELDALKAHRIAAKQYFEALEIPRELAEQVEHICVDQSNEIYYQIDPMHGDFDERDWEGRQYYISDITDRELLPFTKLESVVFNGFNAGGVELMRRLKTRGIDVQDSEMV